MTARSIARRGMRIAAALIAVALSTPPALAAVPDWSWYGVRPVPLEVLAGPFDSRSLCGALMAATYPRGGWSCRQMPNGTR